MSNSEWLVVQTVRDSACPVACRRARCGARPFLITLNINLLIKLGRLVLYVYLSDSRISSYRITGHAPSPIRSEPFAQLNFAHLTLITGWLRSAS